MSLRLVDVNSWLLTYHLEHGRRIIAHRLQSGALREGEIAANVELVDASTGVELYDNTVLRVYPRYQIYEPPFHASNSRE